MPTHRPILTAALDEDTYERWHVYARRHGLTLAALVEAIGRQLDPDVDRLPRWQADANRDALRIAVERRDRRPAD